MSYLELIGMFGVSLYVLSYYLLQRGKLEGQGLTYVVMNLAAASFVLISLTKDFNLASAVIQGFWITISALGIIRITLLRKAKINNEQPNRAAR